MYDELLKISGFDKDEILIYQYLLKNGESSAGDIIKNIDLKRGNAYNKLYSLRDKDLVEQFRKKNRAFFRLTHPAKLREFVENKKKQLNTAENLIDANLEQMVQDFNFISNKPGVYAFAGKEGLIKVYEELLATGYNQDSIEDSGEMAELLGDYAKKEHPRKRKARGIFNRVIIPASNAINSSSTEFLRETRTIPAKDFPFAMDMKIAGQYVVLATFNKTEPLGILIHNPFIAKNFQTLFNYWWDHLAVAPVPESSAPPTDGTPAM